MKDKKSFFTKMKTSAILGISLAVLALPAYSADNGCSNEQNDRINPELALCSTHVYNIGQVENPTSDADKQLIRDVVALKTTVITQQMKKQYDFLEATINRFRTQLRKAVLTAQMEAAGAPSSSSSSSSYSNTGDRNIYLAGTSNCNNESTVSGVFSCLRNNYNLIYNMSNGGTNLTIELRKQLANDCDVLNQNAAAAKITAGILEEVSVDSAKIDCTNYANIKGRNEFQKCMSALNVQIRNATSNLTSNSQPKSQQQG